MSSFLAEQMYKFLMNYVKFCKDLKNLLVLHSTPYFQPYNGVLIKIFLACR